LATLIITAAAQVAAYRKELKIKKLK